MPVLIALGTGLTVALSVMVIVLCLRPKGSPGERLEKYINTRPQPVELIRRELEAPFWERVVVPLWKYWEGAARRLTPAGYLQNIARRLEYAGVSRLTPAGFVMLQAILGIIAFVIGATLVVPKNPANGWVLSLAIGGVAALLPSFQLGSKERKRSSQIARQLPDVLDLLTVSVEAGLGFDAALAKAVEKMSGPLIDEFARVLRTIRMGESRRKALKSMAERSNVPELKLFIGAVLQGDQLGVSISKILRVQSEQMRVTRRQRAQEQAMKAPIKMLFPLVIFIFPALFVVLLGPAIIQISKTLF